MPRAPPREGESGLCGLQVPAGESCPFAGGGCAWQVALCPSRWSFPFLVEKGLQEAALLVSRHWVCQGGMTLSHQGFDRENSGSFYVTKGFMRKVLVLSSLVLQGPDNVTFIWLHLVCVVQKVKDSGIQAS